MEFKEFLEKLQSLELTQESGDVIEDLPDEIYQIWLNLGTTQIQSNLDVDKHRWYENSTTVYKISDKLLGVRGATQMHSESSSFDDLCVNWKFFEMKEVQTITYEEI